MSAARWDLAVVGAGPAGSAAALAALRARPGLRVLLVDREDFPRDKSCGDGVAPHAVEVLDSLGAGDVVDGWAPLRRLEIAAGASRAAGTMARDVHVVPRRVLDDRIRAHALAAGAVPLRHRVRAVRPEEDGVRLDDLDLARVVVAADGARSAVRHALGSGRPGEGRRALALRGYAPTQEPLRGRQVIRYGRRRQPAYAWSFDRGDGWANVGYGELVEGDRRPTRALLLEQLDDLLPGCAEGGVDWLGHHLPLSGWGAPAQPPGAVLLAGDAAGLVNPMTGEGIYYAVATGALAGRCAAEALAEGDPAGAGARYGRAVRRLLDRHLRHTWVAAQLSRSARMVGAGVRAAARDRRAFDDLVELGLGDGRITPRLAASLAVGLIGK